MSYDYGLPLMTLIPPPQFDYNMLKSGWKLVENKEWFKNGQANLQLLDIGVSNKTFLNGGELFKKLRQMKMRAGQDIAEYLLKHQTDIPKEWAPELTMTQIK